MKRLVFIGCLVLALGVGIVLLAKRGRAATQPPQTQDASLLLVRAPKAPTHGLAQFCLTNGTGVRLACVPEAFEQMTAGAWGRLPLTGGGSRTVRGTVNKRSCGSSAAAMASVTLGARESGKAMFDCPLQGKTSPPSALMMTKPLSGPPWPAPLTGREATSAPAFCSARARVSPWVSRSSV